MTGRGRGGGGEVWAWLVDGLGPRESGRRERRKEAERNSEAMASEQEGREERCRECGAVGDGDVA